MARQKYILLCVTGLSPQVITETLYALTQVEKKRIDEICVITTLKGKQEIMKNLLDKNSGKFFAFCKDYKIKPSTIRFNEKTIKLLESPQGRILEDLRTKEEYEWAGDHICEIVRKMTQERNTKIHASAAGGRKTMSIYLTAAMQLFGRTKDELSHVLVTAEFESNQFYYKKPYPDWITDRQGKQLCTDNAEIYLADIPFIRLRGVTSDWLEINNRNYTEVVKAAQRDLDFIESDYDLRLNIRKQTLAVYNSNIKLTKREFFIYVLFSCYRKHGFYQDGFALFNEISDKDLDYTLRFITQKSKGCEWSLEDAPHIGFKFVQTLCSATLVNGKDVWKRQASFDQSITKINRALTEIGLYENYGIHGIGDTRPLRYGLKVSSRKIIFE
jgi:CRISPR-associated protein (TIGR02584 family)